MGKKKGKGNKGGGGDSSQVTQPQQKPQQPAPQTGAGDSQAPKASGSGVSQSQPSAPQGQKSAWGPKGQGQQSGPPPGPQPAGPQPQLQGQSPSSPWGRPAAGSQQPQGQGQQTQSQGQQHQRQGQQPQRQGQQPQGPGQQPQRQGQQTQGQGQQAQRPAWGQQQPQAGSPPGFQGQGQQQGGFQQQGPRGRGMGRDQATPTPPGSHHSPSPGPVSPTQGSQQPQAQRPAWGQQQPQAGPPPGFQGQGQQQGGFQQQGPKGRGKGRGQADPTPPGSHHSPSPSPVSPTQVPSETMQRAPQQKQQMQRGPQQQQQKMQRGPQQQKPQTGHSSSSSPTSAAGDIKAIEDDLNKQFQKMKLLPQAQIIPGKRGRPIPLESNHLTLSIGKLQTAYHYDVDIIPDLPKKVMPQVLEAFRQQHFKNIFVAFDGRKNMYSARVLPFPSGGIQGQVKIKMDRGDKEYKVAIKFAREVDLSPLHNLRLTVQNPMDALTVVDIVLKSAPSRYCISAGRSFFHKPQAIIDLGGGMEMYNGYYQSAIRGGKLLLNVDVAHKAFPKAMNVIDLICELGSDYRFKMDRRSLSQPLNRDLEEKLRKYITKLKIVYEINNQPGTRRSYGVNGLGQPPNVATFKNDKGQMIKVVDYFKNDKRYIIQYPHLPTLWVGAVTKKILLPVELCMVMENQAIKRKMNEDQTSAMIKVAATNTERRKQKIMDGVFKAAYHTDPVMKEFGFSVGNKFEEMQGRVLNPPELKYAGRSVTPQKGIWRSAGQFVNSVKINKWTIAVADRWVPKNLQEFAKMISISAKETGMQMGPPTEPYLQMGRQTRQDIVSYFQNQKKQGFDIIFVVVPNNGPQYSYVKSASEINVGCLTQCIKGRTLQRLNPQVVGNIMLKVNSKLAGVNHFLSRRPPIMDKACMIIGADVTHPSPDSQDPSVAAVVASHDPKAFQYNICWRLQDPRTEVIQDLENIIKEQLMFFYLKTKCKPERIVFFRDGVGEGQFDEIRNVEISAIQKACLSMGDKNYLPPITFVIVQKRHHTRLFPKNPRDSEDRNMNVPAGTCVDHTITNPMMQDFYLVSHASIQGVAKPTKYCTIWDENNFSNDDIEELAYYLCHMFTRCNRSVSYPAPTYYAHLAAARAKVYIENDTIDLNRLADHQKRNTIQDCIRKEFPMFFV